VVTGKSSNLNIYLGKLLFYESPQAIIKSVRQTIFQRLPTQLEIFDNWCQSDTFLMVKYVAAQQKLFVIPHIYRIAKPRGNLPVLHVYAYERIKS